MIDKQQTGFRFGKHRLEVLKNYGQVQHNGRTYRLVQVRTHDGLEYLALRLYNSSGKFIKQFLTEPVISPEIAKLYQEAL